MLSLCDHSCTSSTNVPGGRTHLATAQACCCHLRGLIPLPAGYIRCISPNRFGVQSHGGTSGGGVSGGQAGVEGINM